MLHVDLIDCLIDIDNADRYLVFCQFKLLFTRSHTVWTNLYNISSTMANSINAFINSASLAQVYICKLLKFTFLEIYKVQYIFTD
jgi:hypothetical protein